MYCFTVCLCCLRLGIEERWKEWREGGREGGRKGRMEGW